jgi:SAM-dependent methyltransferase
MLSKVRQLIEIVWSPIALFEISLRNNLTSFIAESNISDQEQWLDVGCGDRPYESLFPKGVYIGIDVKISGRGDALKNPDYFYDGKVLPYIDNSIDGILSTQVLEHVFSTDQYLGEIYRVLKPGGKLLISTPFVWQEHEQPFDFMRWTSFGITLSLKNVGFERIENTKLIKSIESLAMIFNLYLLHNLTPPIKGFGRVLCLLICFPVQIIALILQKILPDKGLFYLENITIAYKPDHFNN